MVKVSSKIFQLTHQLIKEKNLIITFFLSSLILLPNFYLVFSGIDSITASPAKSLIFISLSFSYVILALCILKARTFFILMTPFVFLQFLEILNIKLFGLTTTSEMILSSINTNKNEAFELLSSYPLLVAIAIATGIIYITGLFNLKNTYLSGIRKRILIIITIVSFHLIILIRDYYIAHQINTNGNTKYKISYVAYGFNVRLSKTFPVNTIPRIYNLANYRINVKKYINNTQNFSFNSSNLDTVFTAKTVVLVIGETARAANFGINSYSRNTTPRLSATHNLINFPSAYSNANITIPSLELMLSRATAKTHEVVKREKSFIDAFKKQGYKVYWISNQIYHPGLISTFYAHEADSLVVNQLSLDTRNTTDINLVGQLRDILKSSSNSQNRLIVVHTLGSHFRYNYRYPEEFRQFTPDINTKFGLTELNPSVKYKLINSYDNSILYTDYILTEFIHSVDSQECISTLVYLSDHGENLFDDDKNLLLHGNPEPTTYELHVPMFVWYSDEYFERYQAKIETIKKNKSLIFPTENLPFLLWDLANLHVEHTEKHTISSANYVEPDTLNVFSKNILSYPTDKLKKY